MWNHLFTQPWREYLGLTSLSSRVYFWCCHLPVSFPVLGYRIFQYYITNDGPLSGQFFADLQTCASIPGGDFPLIAASFSHFCWVAKIYDPEFSRVLRLEMRIARFPPPCGPHPDNEDYTRRLDISESVLHEAERIFLVPAKAAIQILTSDRTFLTFHYA